MAAELITSADLALYFASAGARDRYANQDASVTANAIAVATARIVSAAKNQYTEASVDASTAAATNAEIKHFACILAAGALSGGGRERPETIQLDLDEATRWLGFLAGGSVNVPEWTRLGSAATDGSGTGGVRYHAPDHVFDNTDTDSGFYYRDRDL